MALQLLEVWGAASSSRIPLEPKNNREGKGVSEKLRTCQSRPHPELPPNKAEPEALRQSLLTSAPSCAQNLPSQPRQPPAQPQGSPQDRGQGRGWPWGRGPGSPLWTTALWSKSKEVSHRI